MATVERYNDLCAAGVDEDYGLLPEYLVAIAEESPYYAFEVKPAFTNAMGGPVRDEQGCVLDTKGEPIPHLYSAGECGSVWGDVYQSGANIGECLVFGRIGHRGAADQNRGGQLRRRRRGRRRRHHEPRDHGDGQQRAGLPIAACGNSGETLGVLSILRKPPHKAAKGAVCGGTWAFGHARCGALFKMLSRCPHGPGAPYGLLVGRVVPGPMSVRVGFGLRGFSGILPCMEWQSGPCPTPRHR